MNDCPENCNECDEVFREKPYLSKLQTWGILLLIGIIGMIFAFLSKNSEQKIPRNVFSYPCMGTVVNVSFFESDEISEKAAEAVYSEFQKVEKMCSLFDSNSELAELNQNAFQKPFVCSKEFYDLLLKCRKAHADTNGAFDITAKVLMDLWGFYTKRNSIPSPAEIEKAMTKVGMDKVIFNDREQSVKFTVEGMAFDLGGVAKGYALDRAVAAAKNAGAKNFIINLGGNIACFGLNHENKDFFEAGIRNPAKKNTIIEKINIKNSFCATSGNYERFVIIDGKRCSHIMDPLTGYPVSGIYSATAVTSTGIDSDIFSTACFILGEDFSRELVRKNAVENIILITPNSNNSTTLKNIKREEQK